MIIIRIQNKLILKSFLDKIIKWFWHLLNNLDQAILLLSVKHNSVIFSHQTFLQQSFLKVIELD